MQSLIFLEYYVGIIIPLVLSTFSMVFLIGNNIVEGIYYRVIITEKVRGNYIWRKQS